jgi:hypothetical protein
MQCMICPTVQYLSTLSRKQHGFREMLLNINCVFRFSLQRLSETFFSLRGTERDMIKNVYWSPCEVPLFFTDFNENWIFSTGYRKILRYIIYWKSVQWEPNCSMRTDRRTNKHDDDDSLFRNFANAPKSDCLESRLGGPHLLAHRLQVVQNLTPTD